MKIDITKKYRTRGGMPVIIHGFSNPVDGRPLVYSYESGGGQWFLDSCDEDGSDVDGNRMFDLIEVREPREWEIVVSTPANRSHKPGTIDGNATDDLQGGDKRIPNDTWEIIRVREILD